MKIYNKPHLSWYATRLGLALSFTTLTACPATTTNQLDMGAKLAKTVTPKLIGTIKPVNNSTIQGAVSLSPSNNFSGTNIIASISGGTPGKRLTWRVNTGRCGAQSGTLGDEKNYSVFVPAVDGNATAEAVLPFKIDMKGVYSVTVLGSSNEIIGCADLGGAVMPD